MVKNKMKIKWLFICAALCVLWILFWKLEISGANELETGDIATGEEMDEPDMPYEPFFFDEDEKALKRELTVTEMIFALAAAVLAGGISFAVTLKKNRFYWITYQYDIHKQGFFLPRKRENRFINQTVSHRKLLREDKSTDTYRRRKRSSRRSNRNDRKFYNRASRMWLKL